MQKNPLIQKNIIRLLKRGWEESSGKELTISDGVFKRNNKSSTECAKFQQDHWFSNTWVTEQYCVKLMKMAEKCGYYTPFQV